MSGRPALLALACLSAFLLVVPLVLEQPGWPAGLKADEAAYLGMALSLAHDGDLEVGARDVERLFEEFPHRPLPNVVLASDDGWRTVYYGKPYLYPLLAAPLARLLGASGLMVTNMALMLAMMWAGALYLRRYNPGWLAALFASGFFLVSAGFAYVFWLQPEVCNMAAVTACLYLALAAPSPPPPGARWRRLLAHPAARAALSGAALVPAVYHKPMLALVGVPALWAVWRRGRLAGAGSWLAGAAGAMALVVGVSVALTGHVSAYLGWERGGYRLCSPEGLEAVQARAAAQHGGGGNGAEARGSGGEAAAAEGAVAEAAAAVAPPPPPRRSWGWIFNVPRFHLPEVLENLGYFLWGRHSGLLLYFPFASLAVLLFALHGRQAPGRWLLLASLAAVAAVFLLWIPFNWHGGGGFLGNRYYVNAYPAFLFLVTRIAPAWLPLAGYALGGLLLGPLLLSPLGASVPFPTLQSHTRNPPLTWFPLELSLRNVPGYERFHLGGLRFIGRGDRVLPQGHGFWVHGAVATELVVESGEPLDALLFLVRTPAAPNVVELRMGAAAERLLFHDGQAGAAQQVVLRPGKPRRVRSAMGTPIFVYRLAVRARRGAVATWTLHYPPPACGEWPWRASSEESYYLGAEVQYLGPPERVARDVYGLEWAEVQAPSRVAPGEEFGVIARLTNRSAATWPVEPPVAVRLAYHWQTAGGEEVLWEGERTELPAAVEPGEELAVRQRVVAPDEPGRYVLLLDPVFEGVAWFSERGVSPPRLAVEVAAEATDSPP